MKLFFSSQPLTLRLFNENTGLLPVMLIS